MLLEDNNIHLWFADESQFELAELEMQCFSWLSDQDRQRCRRLLFVRHRKQLLLGRLLLRCVLSGYAPSVAPAHWHFTTNAYGKPALDSARHQDRLFFNLSHSQGRFVMAISRHDYLGVDIEADKRSRRVQRIASRYFSPAELASLLALPQAQQLNRFYRLWTLKEAYIKACGLGLAIPLQQFSFAFTRPQQIDVQFAPELEDNTRLWNFWQIEAGCGWQLAVALRRDRNELHRGCAGEAAAAMELPPVCVSSTVFAGADQTGRACLTPAVISRQTKPL